MSDRQRFRFVILGCGNRGQYFASWVKDHPEAGSVVAVAEPNPECRRRVAEQHGLPSDACFERWEDLLDRPRLGDVIVNTMMDRLHAPSALRAFPLGYHMLLEKPMATTLEECVAIDRSAREHGRIVSVCHSLRYHQVYREAKRLIDAGAIGRVVSFDQLEAVDPHHYAHSFVRGNWGNESRSTFMLMSKSCHDVDIVSYLVGRPCKRVSSFGTLTYFKQEYAPPGATPRCTDGCPTEATCTYSALKVYMPANTAWAPYAQLPADQEARLRELQTGRWGRCVYRNDNDVVDHQVATFEYDGGVTGTFTMTAFATGGRVLRVHGTTGWLQAWVDENRLEIHRFSDGAKETITLPAAVGGHGGADANVMENLVAALRANDPSLVLTSTAESLATHRIVFAAERSRREGRVVSVDEVG
jgi:predicted dehydrogenase